MIPEFDCTFTMKDSFKKAVIDRGIQLVWGNADFSNLSDSEMHLSEIIQKSVISVSHKGAVAATSTIADGEYIDDDDNLYYFIADRPFVYAIIEQSTDALLFLGVHR